VMVVRCQYTNDMLKNIYQLQEKTVEEKAAEEVDGQLRPSKMQKLIKNNSTKICYQ